MRFLNDPVLRLRVLGLSLLSGMLTVACDRWRDSIASGGTYLTQDYDAADNCYHLCLTITVVLLGYVAVNLVLAPREG